MGGNSCPLNNRILFGYILLSFVFPVFIRANPAAPDLPEKYRKWVAEDVVYIISPKEKDVFLHLRSDRERDIFIEAFWKHRDPLPGASENKFKSEHYRRIEYANKTFGPSPPGWKTDRGRIHIILGPPMNIQRFTSMTRVYPTELWYYQQDIEGDLPPFFYVVFFDRRGLGEYVLYSPMSDGPQNLLIGEQDHPLNYYAAYQKLYDYDATLARVAVSLIPGESSNPSTPSLASDLLIQRIAEVPKKKVNDIYADNFLKFKDVIEVEYSANFISNDNFVRIITDESGTSFVNYFIELDKLAVNQYEDTFYTTLKINGAVTAEPGRMVYQFEKTYPIKLSRDQFENVNKSSLGIYDIFPMIPGDFNFSLIIKNTVSKEFSSFEQRISIPKGPELRMTPPLFAYDLKRNDGPGASLMPFQIRNQQLLCQPSNIYLRENTLYVYFQVFGLDDSLMKNGSAEFVFTRDEKEYSNISRTLSDLSEDGRNYLAEFALKEFPFSNYKLAIGLFDQNHRKILSQAEYFVVSPAERIPRPVIVSRTLTSSKESVLSYILGSQYLNEGGLEKGVEYLEKAFRENPESLEFALGLSHAYDLQKRYDKIESILLPFKNDQEPNAEILDILARTAQRTNRFELAIQLYGELTSRFGSRLDVLNSIGDCHYKLGHFSEARAAWKKSLEINPNQPGIKKRFDAIKE